ncbi:MAG: hypothetical protein IPM00_15915 [Tetrasphaera sp.]|nr:hypothetical protein [Tetrasphaera sp.]
MAETVPPGNERNQRKSNKDRAIITPTICNKRLMMNLNTSALSSVGDPAAAWWPPRKGMAAPAWGQGGHPVLLEPSRFDHFST